MPAARFGQPPPHTASPAGGGSPASPGGRRQRVWLSQGEIATVEAGVRQVKNQLLSERKTHAAARGRLQQELEMQQAIAHRLYQYLKLQSLLGGLVGGRRERLCELAAIFAPRWEPGLARRFLSWRAVGAGAAAVGRAVAQHRRRWSRRICAGCLTEWRSAAGNARAEAGRTLVFQLGLASLSQRRVDRFRGTACFGAWRDWALQATRRRAQATMMARGVALRAISEVFEVWRGQRRRARHREGILRALLGWRARGTAEAALREWRAAASRMGAQREIVVRWDAGRRRGAQASFFVAWALASRRRVLLESRFQGLRNRKALRRRARAWAAWRELMGRREVARDSGRILADRETEFSTAALEWEAERDGLLAGLEEAGLKYRALEDDREAEFGRRLADQRGTEQGLRRDLEALELTLSVAAREREEAASRYREDASRLEAEADAMRNLHAAALAEKDAVAEAYVQTMQKEHEIALERARLQTLAAETRLRDKLEAQLGLMKEAYAGKEKLNEDKLERQSEELRLACERASTLEDQAASERAALDGQAEALVAAARESERLAAERLATLESENIALVRQREQWRGDVLGLGMKRLAGRLREHVLLRAFRGWKDRASALVQAGRMRHQSTSLARRALFLRWREETVRRARGRAFSRSPRRGLLNSIQSLREALEWGPEAPSGAVLEVFLSHTDHMRWERKLHMALWHWRGLVGLNQTSANVSRRFTAGRRLRSSFAAWVACADAARAWDFLALRTAQRLRRGLTGRVFGHWRREAAAVSLQKRRLVEAMVRWSARAARDALRAWQESVVWRRARDGRISVLETRWGARVAGTCFNQWTAALSRSQRQRTRHLGIQTKWLRRLQRVCFSWWLRWCEGHQSKMTHRAALETVMKLERSLHAQRFQVRTVEIERDEAKERLSDMMTAVSSLNWKLQDRNWEGPPWQLLANLAGSASEVPSAGPATQDKHIFSNRFASPREARSARDPVA